MQMIKTAIWTLAGYLAVKLADSLLGLEALADRLADVLDPNQVLRLADP